MPYQAPTEDIRFVLENVAGFDAYRARTGHEAAEADTVAAILSEAAHLAETRLAPLQRAGDETPARLENGVVRTPPGFAEGYRALADGGWIGMTAAPEHGGMGLPTAIAVSVHEMIASACLSLQLNPLLAQGQIRALEAHASRAIRETYLGKLASGDWAATMNLTEPQAGSDVGALRTHAEPAGDGTYRITGQKIYITWGDNDFTENVVHLVLARLPDAAPGTRGISLFVVPKHLPRPDGTPGPANDLRVVSLEHKMGLHGAPTAVMEYTGATGWMVGAENGGMAAMFTMMNEARLAVAIQGTGVAEAACQQATEYAAARVQGQSTPTGTIIDYPDVRRMLIWMRARTAAARAINLACATAMDMETATGEGFWKARAAFLIPIAKSYGSETGIEVAQMGIQVHGGMGYIEETGAAQYLRDVRVSAIYEGTNGIQSMDLAGRKLADGGEAAAALLDEIEAGAEDARPAHPDLAGKVWEAAEALREATEWMVAQPDMKQRFAGSVAFQSAWGLVLGAHYHLRGAHAEGTPGPRTALARSFILRQLPGYLAHLSEATLGGDDLFALSPEALGA